MNYSEKWGKDVDEAVRLALDDLGATEDQIKVTVIEEPSKGFLGLGAKLAKVRVELLEVEDPATIKNNSKNVSKQQEGNKHKRDLRKKNNNGNKIEGYNKNNSGDRDRRSGGDRKRSGRNERGGKDYKSRDDDYAAIEIDLSDKPVLSERPENLVVAQDSDAAVFLKEIIKKMGIDIDINSFKNDECFYIEISGKDSRTVIGKRGQTLDSLQYLTNLVVNKDRSEYIRTIIDVEGYRSRREKTLEQLGAKLARKVLKTGRPVKLEPMNPYERKVIHSTLQGIEGITTRSEGEEPYRRVIIEKK